jgi:hypothetical protein
MTNGRFRGLICNASATNSEISLLPRSLYKQETILSDKFSELSKPLVHLLLSQIISHFLQCFELVLASDHLNLRIYQNSTVNLFENKYKYFINGIEVCGALLVKNIGI